MVQNYTEVPMAGDGIIVNTIDEIIDKVAGRLGGLEDTSVRTWNRNIFLSKDNLVSWKKTNHVTFAKEV